MHPFDVSKSLETPMNKGILESSKNYEFTTISAITVPKRDGLGLGELKKDNVAGIVEKLRGERKF